MGFIRAKAKDTEGNTIDVKYEAPPGAVAYLKPSGKTYVNPMYAWAVAAGASDESIRTAHRGFDGKGNEGVSDQRWIFDVQEAARLQLAEPDRFVQVE
jgi:hypothetical protein